MHTMDLHCVMIQAEMLYSLYDCADSDIA